MQGEDAFQRAEKVNDIATNPKKYIKAISKKFHDAKEGTKEAIKTILPSPIKPIMEGDSGDVVLLIIFVVLVGIFMKFIGFALRIIMKFIFIASIIAAAYIIYQKYFGG